MSYIYKPLGHFQFMVLRVCSNFIDVHTFQHVTVQLSQHHLLKRLTVKVLSFMTTEYLTIQIIRNV